MPSLIGRTLVLATLPEVMLYTPPIVQIVY